MFRVRQSDHVPNFSVIPTFHKNLSPGFAQQRFFAIVRVSEWSEWPFWAKRCGNSPELLHGIYPQLQVIVPGSQRCKDLHKNKIDKIYKDAELGWTRLNSAELLNLELRSILTDWLLFLSFLWGITSNHLRIFTGQSSTIVRFHQDMLLVRDSLRLGIIGIVLVDFGGGHCLIVCPGLLRSEPKLIN